MTTSAAQALEAEPREVRARRAVKAACLGFFVDMFDVYLPIAALAPAISYFIPPNLSPVVESSVLFLVFAVTLIGRPVGAVIFGHFADTLGRRRTTLVSVAGFTVVTLLIAVLPGYPTLGFSVIVLLILLRFLDGVFIGGEYTAANPLAMEYSPKERRGLYGSLIHVGYPGALLVMSALTAVMTTIAPADGADSDYARWGWRIPFLLGVALSAGLFFYYLRKVPESDLWQSAEKPKSPLRELLRGPNLRRLAQLFVVMSGAWLTLNATVGALPGVAKVLEADVSDVNTGTLIAAGIAVPLFPLLGMLSQRWGRRPTIAAIGALNAVPAALLYFLLVGGGYRSSTGLVVLVAGASLLGLLIWAVHTPYLVESFRTGVRSAGYGIAYSLATIIPGFYSFYLLGLGKIMPYAYTPIVLLVLGGVLLVAGALTGPETRDTDFAAVEDVGATS
ncbi:MAG: MFS transporter [Carbonactinosporaceae bacterium]